jgi:uncharacterized protein
VSASVDEPLRVCVVPRWGGTANSDWYPFLAERVAAGALPTVEEAVVAPLRPDPDEAAIAECVASVEATVGDQLDHTLLVGHSLGCRALLHYLAARSDGERARGLLCVAGWWTVDEPWESLRPWIEEPLDVERARRAAGPVHVLVSDDDPFTADHEATCMAWARRMGAEVTTRPGGKHFNGAHEISVLINLAALLMEAAGGLLTRA